MSGQHKGPKHTDSATPTLRKPKRNDSEKVQATRTTSESIKASPNWAAAVGVQGAVAKWNQDADAIEAKAVIVRNLRDQLKTAMSSLRTVRRDWRASTQQVLSTVNVFSAGSVDTVRSFALDVLTHNAPGALVAPDRLTVSRGKTAGEVLAKWKRGNARHGFVVQHATDFATPTTYSALEPSTKSTCTLGGLPPGTNAYVRVAAIDPNGGHGPWSAWVPGTVA